MHILAANGAFLAPQAIEATENGLIVKSTIARSEVAWSAFIGKASDAKNHYLFIDVAQALIIPREVVSELGADFESRI